MREDKTAREMFTDMLDHLDELELCYTYHKNGIDNRIRHHFKDIQSVRRMTTDRKRRLGQLGRSLDQLEQDWNRGSKRKIEMTILRKEREGLAAGLSLVREQEIMRTRMLSLNKAQLQAGTPLHFSKSSSPPPRGAYHEALEYAQQEGERRAKRVRSEQASSIP